MVAKVPPNGIWVPVPTFFHSPGPEPVASGLPPVDFDTQAEHAVFLAGSGISGLLLFGSTGEAISLTRRERVELLLHVRSALANAGYEDFPLMAGTATQGVDETLAIIRESADAGADWAMCLAPGYFAAQADQDGLAEWYELIADRSALPVTIYYYPGVSNSIKMLPSTFARLSKHQNIVGCKLSHGDLSATTQVVLSAGGLNSESFKTFTGLGQQLIPVLSVGGAGAIDALSGVFPRAVVSIFKMYMDQERENRVNVEAMRMVQLEIARGEELVAKYGAIGVKEALHRTKGLGDPKAVRLPLKNTIDDEKWEEFADIIDRIRGFEDKLEEGGIS